jgi:chromosome segregation ATPase
MKIEELNDNILNLKDINEITNKQLREKIENEQIILKENLKYKNEIDQINIQNEESNRNLKKEINTYKNLTKTFNTIKSENIDLQKKINESNQEKTKLIDTNNKILEEKKNFDEKYKIILSKLSNVKNIEIQAESFDEFLQNISDEIIRITSEKEKLTEDIKILNLKCFNMAQENENINQENNELKSILSKLKNEYDKELKEKDDIVNQFDNCKMMNYQLQKTLDDYGTELNNKINDLNNLAYDKSEIENKNIQLNKDKQFLLTLILRINKLYSLSNIYELVKNLFNKGNITNNKNDFNEKLVEELQRCQDYVNILKENDLQTHLLNLKLNQEIQETKTQN